MYFEDNPIKKQEEDLLGRSAFSKHLGRILVEGQITESYCIGLYGSWGSGKSSIINMVKEEIEQLSSNEYNSPIVMHFNPWNFSTKEQLFNQFFLMLADEFCGKKSKRMNAIGRELRKYSSMLTVFGDVGKIIDISGKAIGGLLQKFSGRAEDNNITKQRELIIKKIEEQQCRIIIVIDDIDRLSNEEIKLVFQLVKSVANFPNTIYLLSFDKDVVVEALSDVQGYDGDKYLEKIVQVPISIPKVSESLLEDILTKKLNELFEIYNGSIFDREYWSMFFYRYVKKHIKNIRDIIRLTNALNIKCMMIGNEINFVDIIAITIIELKMPRLYSWIKENKNILVGSEQTSLMFIGKNKQEKSEIYSKFIYDLDPINSSEYLDILKFLFPYFSASIEQNQVYRNESLRRNLRIADPDIFDRYFVLELNQNDISRSEFNYAMQEMDAETLDKYFKGIYESNSIKTLLREIEAAKNDISEERVKIVIKVLAENAHHYIGNSNNGIFGLSDFQIAVYQIRSLFKQLRKEEDRASLLKYLIRNCNCDSIQTIVYLVDLVELAHGRIVSDRQPNIGEMVIPIEEVENIEHLLLYKIKTISQEVSLISLDCSQMVLHLFEFFDKDGYKTYMNEQLEDDLNKLRYLGFFVKKWTGDNYILWRRESGYEEFLSDEQIYITFKKCVENNSLWELEQDIIHRVVAFCYWNDFETGLHGEVNDKDVIEKIKMLQK